MLITEWSLDEAKEVWREEGREQGIGIGRKEGRGEGRKEILSMLKSGKSPEEVLKEYGDN